MPILKTPIGDVNPVLAEELKKGIDSNYGHRIIDTDSERVLIIGTPAPDPDPVNDLENGIAHLEDLNISIDRVILIGIKRAISIDGRTAGIVLERMRKNPRMRHMVHERTAKSRPYDEFEETFYNSLRDKGFMISENEVPPCTIAARSGAYPGTMILKFCGYCSEQDLAEASRIVEVLGADLCLMIYENAEKKALQAALGKKIELISRKDVNILLEML